ncbi:MAG: hypothetical protein OEY14_13670, partial [Myxococcales bacterium]|nr:hypothetical protein [Myxococcales bacterium]
MYSRRSVFFLVSLMVLAGCVVSPRRGGGYTIGPRGGGSSQGGGASAGGGGMAQAAPPVARATSTEPRALLDEADGHLRARGFQMVGSAVRNPSLSAGQQVAYLLDAQPNACFVAIALGAAGTDLDMVLVDPMGSNIAHHVSPDPTPWVQVCPNQPGRHVIRVQMRRGVGEHYYALYRGPSRADSQLGALLGGGVTQAQTAQLDPGTAARLEALDRSLAADRFGRAQEPMSAVLGEGEERRFPLSLEGGRCYAFATLGGPGARDTDLHILDAGETRLGGDSSVDVDATVR